MCVSYPLKLVLKPRPSVVLMDVPGLAGLVTSGDNGPSLKTSLTRFSEMEDTAE
jgi:hypothetical protein